MDIGLFIVNIIVRNSTVKKGDEVGSSSLAS